MREPKEIYEEFKKSRGLNFCEGLEDVFELMKFAQIEGYNEAVEDAANQVDIELENHCWVLFDKQSILKLKK